jgi:hypothetical protein
MDKTQFDEIMGVLKGMSKQIDVLIRITKSSAPAPNIPPEEEKVLRLCDKKHTIKDIVHKTGKTETTVKSMLSHLRSKGLIQSTKSKDKLVYKKV